MKIRLYIDRLILDGLPVSHSQGPLVQRAVEAELTRLLSEYGFAASLQTSITVPSMRANELQLASENNPSQMGKQIAQSVHGGIGNVR